MNKSNKYFYPLTLVTLLVLSVSACQDSATESTAQVEKAQLLEQNKSTTLKKPEDFFEMSAVIPEGLVALDANLKDRALVEPYLNQIPTSTQMVYTITENGQPEGGGDIKITQQYTLARILENGTITNNLIDKGVGKNGEELKEEDIHILIWDEGETDGMKTANPFVLMSIEIFSLILRADQFDNPLFNHSFRAQVEEVDGIQMIKAQMPTLMSDKTEVWFYPTEKYLIPARMIVDDEGDIKEYIYKKYVVDEPIAAEVFNEPKDVHFINLDSMMNLDIFKSE